MKEMKRILSFVLALVLVLGLVPVSALQANAQTAESTIVIAASDYQSSDGSNPAESTAAILNAIKTAGYETADGFLFGGDYSTDSTPDCLTELQGIVDSYYADADKVYIQGNHDSDSAMLSASGAHDTDAYGVYVINYKDFPKDASSSAVQATANALDQYLDAKVAAGYEKPIFVLSHLPLHAGRGDNENAGYLAEVLNEAGEAGLNIIFLAGHNHSSNYDYYLGNAAYYLPVGSSLPVASDGGYTTVTTNFTYMNYGYVGFVRDKKDNIDVDRTLTATVFEITEDEVTVKRYDANGLHVLKAKGVDNKEDDRPVNEQVINSPATIALTSVDNDNNDDNDNNVPSSGYTYELVTEIIPGEKYVIVSEEGATGANGAVTEALVGIADEGYDYQTGTQSVTVNGTQVSSDVELVEWVFTQNADGTYTISSVDGTKTFSYHDSDWQEDGEGDATFDIKAGTKENHFKIALHRDSGTIYHISYRYDSGESTRNPWSRRNQLDSHPTDIRLYKATNSSGGGAVTPGASGWATVVAPQAGDVTAYNYVQVTSITANEKYVIVDGEQDVVLMGDLSAQTATVSGTTLTSTTALTEWTFGGTGETTIVSGGKALEVKDDKVELGNTDKKSKVTVTDGSIVITKKDGKAWLYYNGEKWAATKTAAEYVRLYKQTKPTTSEGTPGLYAKVTGTMAHTVTRGLTAEQVIEQYITDIQASIYEGHSAPGADETGEDVTEELSFSMQDGYDGTVAGDYYVNVNYDGKVIGTVKITVPEIGVLDVVLKSYEGTVEKGANANADTGAVLEIQYENNTVDYVPVTVSMLSGEFNTKEVGDYTGLTVTYNDETYTNFTLHVTPKTGNNYPEYPKEGAVKVNKTATGIDFQASGVAQVELSTSGIPMNQGVDILLVLDATSSMDEGKDKDEEGKEVGSRRELLVDAADTMLQNLAQKREDGSTPDVKVQVITFGGYEGISGKVTVTNDKNEGMNPYNYLGSPSSTHDYESEDLTKGWVPVGNLTNGWIENNFTHKQSGTNYDSPLEDAYDILAARKAENEAAGVDRKQIVLFLSDGVPYQYNGVNSSGDNIEDRSSEWWKWLMGDYESKEDIPTTVQRNYYYYEGANGNGQKHWAAEAIKGVPGQMYSMITYATDDAAGHEMIQVEGLGATLYSIALALDEEEADSALILEAIASSSEQFYNIKVASDLEAALTDFSGAVLMAATNARYVDQMGDSFSLQMSKHDYASTGSNTKDKTITPTIEVISYDIYGKNDTIPTGKNIGDRKGTSTVLETVTFSDDGKKAYSSLIGADTNILGDDGIIRAKTFFYNTNPTPVAVDGVAIPNGINADGTTTAATTNLLPAETFYWNIGSVMNTELAIRYYVYLDGSMEGLREAGSYPTNEYAVLYYDNYLENPCYKETVSPSMAWESANVSYAFYLVNDQGQVIVNQTTGETGTFANKIAVTNPVVYKEILLNSSENIEALTVVAGADDVLPDYYTLYDETAAYRVNIRSSATGSWVISNGGGTTYVTNYTDDASAYSNAETNDDGSNDYTHTVVWFAVKWTLEAHPDAVVVDYGLPVNIHVLSNDMFGDNGKLAAVGPNTDGLAGARGNDTLAEGFGNGYTGAYGTAAVNGDVVTYTPANMNMASYDKFMYAVNYTGATGTNSDANGYYYDTVTVIPATTIYYEDSFITFSNADGSNGLTGNVAWETEGTAIEGATQGEDRPGKYSLQDANNIYGYDSVNKGMSQFSLGSAKKVTVDATHYASAEFTFTGTGFDIIGMTDSTTGVLVLRMYNAEGERVVSKTVDTYYGYNYTLCDVTYTYKGGEWICSEKTISAETTEALAEIGYNPFVRTGIEYADPENSEDKTLYNVTYNYENGKWVRQEINVETDKVTDPDAELSAVDTTTAPVTEQSGVEYAWIPVPSSQALYQVPVLEVADMPYGQYRVQLIASYASAYDHNTEDDGYTLYLDAVRIYDPAGDGVINNSDGTTDTTIQDAYKADGEGWPTYVELRNMIIDANTMAGTTGSTRVEGMVYIDGKSDVNVDTDAISDYISYGPNNEVYLEKGDSIAFMVNAPATLANMHIGIKSAFGNTASVEIWNIDNIIDDGQTVSKVYGDKIITLDTTTDMYYDLTPWKNDIIVIKNVGGEGTIVSLTNIKFTYTQDPYGVAPTAEDEGMDEYGIAMASLDEDTGESGEAQIYMTYAASMLTLRTMRASAEEETPEEEIPEETVPEETVPEETVPEDTKPAPGKKPGKDEKPAPGKENKPGKDEKPAENTKPAPGKNEKPGKKTK